MLIHLISIALFSSWPQYAIIFLHCARYNPQVQFTLVTNLDEHHPSWREQFGGFEKPNNVHFAHYTFEQIVARIQEDNLGLGIDLKVTAPYKLTDYKPMYGVLFRNELMGCTHWGWFDIDIYVGNIKATYECGYANEDFISYDKYYKVHGPLMVLRNSDPVNTFYRNMLAFPKAVSAFIREEAISFDEKHMPYLISRNRSVRLKRFQHRNCESYIWMWYKGDMQSPHSACVIRHFGGGGPIFSKLHKAEAWRRSKSYFSDYYQNEEYGYGELQKPKGVEFSYVFTFTAEKEFKIINTTSAANFPVERYMKKYHLQLSLVAAKFLKSNSQCNASMPSL